MIRIDKIRLVRSVDDTGGVLFDLGEYSDAPGPADRTVDRFKYLPARDQRRLHQLRYFIAEMSAEDTGNPKSVQQDYRRAEAYNDGKWWAVGICAEAVVSYEIGNKCRRLETLISSGLWGIESDSDASYLASVEQDELADLREHLKVFGVDVGACPPRD